MVRSAGAPHRQNRRAVTERAYEMLADGKWHDREELVRTLMSTIPPGEAWRENERIRLGERMRSAQRRLSPEEYEAWLADPANLERDPYRGATDMSTQVRSGQRAIVMGVLSKGRGHSRRLDTRKLEDGTMQIRLLPEPDRYRLGYARRAREEWIAEHPGEEVDEAAIRKKISREAARRRSARLKAEGYIRSQGKWIKPEE